MVWDINNDDDDDDDDDDFDDDVDVDDVDDDDDDDVDDDVDDDDELTFWMIIVVTYKCKGERLIWRVAWYKPVISMITNQLSYMKPKLGG